jgi:hypothetical protein
VSEDEREERLERFREWSDGLEPREIEWPPPRKDPPEEPSEPWARAGQHPQREWPGWEELRRDES